jgi:hypothetical protein
MTVPGGITLRPVNYSRWFRKQLADAVRRLLPGGRNDKPIDGQIPISGVIALRVQQFLHLFFVSFAGDNPEDTRPLLLQRWNAALQFVEAGTDATLAAPLCVRRLALPMTALHLV